MKNLLLLLLLPFFCMACKENENGGEEEEEPTYPVELQGTWRPAYSKTIYPAEMVNDKPVGIGDYHFLEYFGGYPGEEPKSGIFYQYEYKIRFEGERIYIYIYEDYNERMAKSRLTYDMEKEIFHELSTAYNYHLENDTLTVIKYPQKSYGGYTMSNYVKTDKNWPPGSLETD